MSIQPNRYTLEFDERLSPSPTLAALIWGINICPPRPTTEPPAFLAELLHTTKSEGRAPFPEETRQRVRAMLRFGKYKPSGRAKPASEFLLRAALEDAFPLVTGPVDVNNAISLASGLPGSVFDADLAGTHLLLRRGHADEEYVFNPTGQAIDLEDLLLVCRQTKSGWEPCGNPVKDSMATKIGPTTKNVIAVLYAPADEPTDVLKGCASRFAQLLQSHCAAEETGFLIAG
jgi:DNA/RNA-binding domain of Phe-tRNA-synthetase-like protein